MSTPAVSTLRRKFLCRKTTFQYLRWLVTPPSPSRRQNMTDQSCPEPLSAVDPSLDVPGPLTGCPYGPRLPYRPA